MTRGHRVRAGLAGAPTEVDLVVIGLGCTGAGIALDAVARGLSVLAVDAHDLAFGTSRWSSKLVHGGLRYLAQGQVGVAHESAVERGLLMSRIAPHLTGPMPMLLPLTDDVDRSQTLLLRAGLVAGDLLRRGARTPSALLPPPRRLSPTETDVWAPGLRTDGRRGALLSWDGRLEDDARLVVAIARTAAHHGAHVRTRARALNAHGRGVRLRDETTGAVHDVAARTVVNAAGVWAGSLTDGVRLRPSRGTHLVLRGEALPGLNAALQVPLPGERSRFGLVLPQPDGTVYVGLTDVPVTGPVPDVPEPSGAEVDDLLAVLAAAFSRPPTREHVVGAYAGLRPLLDAGPDRTADLSRAHATIIDRDGLITCVGGKLTTYRRMAEDAVDVAVAHAGLDAGPCRTRRLPLLGAAARGSLPAGRSARLTRRFGTEADLVLDSARERTGWSDDRLLAPLAAGVPVTMAELVFGVTHEGAHDVDDLLDRRTRVGLVPADRPALLAAAEQALGFGAARCGAGLGG